MDWDSSIFQSTPSQRGRPYNEYGDIVTEAISIHALAKRATRKISSYCKVSIISIHTLAKRATAPFEEIKKQYKISIHALAKRATFNFYHLSLIHFAFQSTPSQRGRRWNVQERKRRKHISIHALAKRATISVTLTGHVSIISIHALVKRATNA